MFNILFEFIVKLKDYFLDIYLSEIESIDNFYRVNG